jgi:hypothetical protein
MLVGGLQMWEGMSHGNGLRLDDVGERGLDRMWSCLSRGNDSDLTAAPRLEACGSSHCLTAMHMTQRLRFEG